MAAAKRVIVTGATGLIGKRVCARLEARGYRVVVFSRNPEQARRSMRNGSEFVAWEAEEHGDWEKAVDGAYAVIHLAGANNFAKRWSKSFKQEIKDSRVIGTRGLVNAMRVATVKPSVFICASGIDYYEAGDTEHDENGPAGNRFLSEVVKAWEHEASKAEDLGVRTVLLRTGVVLGSGQRGLPLLPLDLRGASLSRPGVILDFKYGALPLMALPYRFFIGGPIAGGKQWFSWIHLDDQVGIIMFVLENEQARGPINSTAPEPLTHRDFGRTLGLVMDSPSWFPLPGFALKLLLGDVSQILTKGLRIVPRKVQELGYQFKYPTAESALRHLVKK